MTGVMVVPQSASSNLTFYGPSINPDWNPNSVLAVMTLDDCFRLLLLDTSDLQLSEFLDQAADLILNHYPFGLNFGDIIAPAQHSFHPAFDK